jgi:hypothetical protein
MNEHSDIEEVLGRWFDEGPSRMPDRVALAVADRIDRQRQRRAWRLPWRFPAMNLPFKFGAAALAVVLIAIVGYNLLPGTAGVGVPSATPTTAPTPTPTPTPSPSPSASPVACEDDLPGCAGPLAAGAHTSTSLDPALAFVTPDGWTNVVDTPTIFKLDPVEGDAPYLIVWTRPVIADMSETCIASVRPDAGTAIQDWIDYLSTDPRLVASDPVPVELGGISGESIDVRIAPDWTTACPGFGYPVVQFIWNTDPLAGDVVYGVAVDSTMHLVLLDIRGQTVIVQAYGSTTEDVFRSQMEIIQPIIDSFRFSAGT